MQETCETVRIVAGDSFVIINAEDFDKKTMTLYVEKVEKETPTAKGK